MSTIRPDVVDLFRRVDAPSLAVPISSWTINGQPISPSEAAVLASMTKAEGRAALDLDRAELETQAAELQAGEQLIRLLEPHMAGHPTRTVSEAVDMLPPEQRARAEHLLRHGLPNYLVIRKPHP